jgi:hypothetical protein
MRFLVPVLACLLPVAAASARQQGTEHEATSRKELRAARLNGTPAPRLDGSLDDEAWRSAPFTADFIAKQPIEGAPPKGRTDVAFLYDDDALYIGVRMGGAVANDVRALLTRRDQWGTSEVVVFALDSYLDRRTAYTFGVTAAGTRIDFYQPTDSEGSRDFSYQPVWDARVSVDSAGWTAELRIPFSQLRFSRREVQTWGLNINRYIPSRTEDTYRVMIPRTQTGWSSRFGNLVGIEDIRPSRRLEFLPYVAGNVTAAANVAAADPFHDPQDLSGRIGGDVKMGRRSRPPSTSIARFSMKAVSCCRAAVRTTSTPAASVGHHGAAPVATSSTGRQTPPSLAPPSSPAACPAACRSGRWPR